MPIRKQPDAARRVLAARVPEETHRALLHLAVDKDTTVQALVEAAVERLLRGARGSNIEARA
jgi:hypothetical protein